MAGIGSLFGGGKEKHAEDFPVKKSDAEWRAQLTPAQYRIARAQGTEHPFCGTLLDNHKTGTYHCVCCDLPLFSSDAKFNSGTGWPSFFQPVSKENVATISDRSHGMVRVDVMEALIEATSFLHGVRPADRHRIAVMTGSGGLAAASVCGFGGGFFFSSFFRASAIGSTFGSGFFSASLASSFAGSGFFSAFLGSSFFGSSFTTGFGGSGFFSTGFS